MMPMSAGRNGRLTALLIAALAFAPADADASEETPPRLSAVQIDNLYLLGKVWGYLKYHHPRVTANCLDWDAELLREIDAMISASDHAAAQARIEAWISVVDSAPCTEPEVEEVHFRADRSWIGDPTLVGEGLRDALQEIPETVDRPPPQHYVARDGTGIALRFSKEKRYEDIEEPDLRYRLLALFRYWNIVEYWFPYRDLIRQDWDSVLKEFTPRLADAEGTDAFAAELVQLIGRIDDGHAYLAGETDVRPPHGSFYATAELRHIEGRPVVWRVPDAPSDESNADRLQFGDVILAVDGRPVDELYTAWHRFYPASNESHRNMRMTRNLLRGDDELAGVRVERDGVMLDIDVHRSTDNRPPRFWHDRDGPALQQLSEEVFYLKLSAVQRGKVREYLEQAGASRGLIIDIRNYPSAFMPFELGGHLVTEPTEFVLFTKASFESPGTFVFSPGAAIEPREPHYAGRVVILVDDASISQSEYTAMALRSPPGAVVIGSQTAGADGNVARIPLLGGFATGFSSIGVLYPDKTPTQQIGIVPDIEVRPTIAGIRAGRDEVLEAAVRHVLGDEVAEDELRRMTRLPHAPGL